MIAVDIGNTHIHLAQGVGKEISKTFSLSTPKATPVSIKKIIAHYPDEYLIVCSAVPQLTKLFTNLRRKVLLAGKNFDIPIKCFYATDEVGADRLVAAFASKIMFKNVRIIIDCGTAITFDFISKRGEYLGGMILPGIGSTLKVLSSCAMLPKKIKLKNTGVLIPKDTKTSISKGILEGFSEMLNALTDKYSRRLNLSSKDKIILTGGDASLIKPRLNFPYVYEPRLVLKGLFILGNKLVP